MKLYRLLLLTLLALSPLLRAQSNPVPFVNQPLVPASAAPGGKAFTLTINGTGFTSSSAVQWNGVSLTTTVVSGQKLTAKVPATKIANAGTAWVTVVNPGAPVSNLVFFPIASSEPSVGFAESILNTGGSADFPVAGDFNNDGKLDLAFNNVDGVSIVLGNGDGTFGSALANYDCNPGALAVGDFNGDGKLDVAATNIYGTQVLLGNGDGTFTTLPIFYTGSYGGYPVAGDFNGDGKLDLAVVQGYWSSNVSIYLGNGDGTFTYWSGETFGLEAGAPVIGDFNGDGKLDLAAADQYGLVNTVLIALGNGDGTFQPAVSYPTGSAPGWVAAADFNADSKLDLAATAAGSNAISILLGNGDGTFPTHTDYAAAAAPEQITVGDLNADGKLDLAMAAFNPGLVSVLLGNGDGTFQNHTDFPTASNPRIIALGDFNNDGRLDLVVDGGGSIFLLLQSTASLAPISLTFAAQNVSTTSPPQAVTLINSGSSALTINSITVTGTNPADFLQSNTCGTNLPAGSSCTINITFSPTLIGTRAATLSVSDNAAGSPQTVTLTGTGTAPVVTLSSTSLTFPTQLKNTLSTTQQVTLTNAGTGLLTITSISVTGDFIEQNTCGSTVAVGASCTITVQFQPRQKGTRTGVVSIVDDAAGSPQTISLSGVGTIVKLSGIGLNFGNQKVGTSSHPVTVRLTNISNQTLNIGSISLTGNDPEDFAITTTCGSTVAAHASCTISVTFTPTMTGTRSATLSIADDGGGSPQTVSLSGTGT